MIYFGDFFYLPEIDLGEGAKRASGTTFDSKPLFAAKVYPNPADNYVSFAFTGTLGMDIILSITDQNGKQIKTLKISGKRPVKSISIKGVPSGQYYYKAISGEQVITGKLSIIK